MEDRSALFNQLKNFSQRKLKKVETKVVTSSGEQLVEKRGAKGLQVLTSSEGTKNQEAEPVRKLDLQVGLVLPGFLIGSQDVAHDKSSLDSYGVTHILNLDGEIENKFEDDYNYKNINIQDRPDFVLDKIFEDCFDFIDDGRHYGNVLVHCSGTIGLSRSTSICIAYLMNKEKQKFDEAFNNVKEARSFVKPSEGFLKQLKDYEVKLRGAQEIKDSGIDDPFALRKKQEIEKEKAMVAGAASVKNRMKMFGATLDTNQADSNRSKSVSPSPAKITQQQQSNSPTVSKWSVNNPSDNKTSKSMTPEPRKSWQSSQSPIKEPDWRSNKNNSSSNLISSNSSAFPPPPPPPMPLAGSLSDNKSNKSLPPPPPPPPPSGDLLKGPTKTPKSPYTSSSSSSSNCQEQRKKSTDSQSSDTSRNNDSGNNKRMVFGRVPPPPMKIKGGLSIERNDATCDANLGFTRSTPHSKASLQLPLKKQLTTDSGSESENQVAENPRAPSPSAALRAAKQQAAAKFSASGQNDQDNQQNSKPSGQLNRSSTKKLLNLIKTKTKTDLTLSDGDENDEIEALLGALESESIENIDWDELGLDEDEVKDIIQKGGGSSSPSASSSSSSSSSSGEETDEIETSTTHYVIRTK